MTLALSVVDEYRNNKALLSKPITTLARMAGLTADDVYRRLLPELIKIDNLEEAVKYAEVALKYASIIDSNRLREEVGETFVFCLGQIFRIVEKGLDSKEPWIKRKSMMLHGSLIDEHAEKKRFVETILVEEKLRRISELQKGMDDTRREIADFIATDRV